MLRRTTFFLANTSLKLFKTPKNLQFLSSFSFAKLEKSGQKIKYEEENYEKDNTIESTLQQHGFSFVERENDSNMELVKNVDGTEVVINFQARAPQTQDEGGEEEEQEGKDAIEEKAEVNDMETYKNTPRFERLSNRYCGPDFSSLDERLQSSFMDYLKSYGINEEVAAIVEHLSLDKEQRLYMNWLKDMKGFLE